MKGVESQYGEWPHTVPNVFGILTKKELEILNDQEINMYDH